MTKERITGVFITAVLAIVLACLLRPDLSGLKHADATEKNWFFINKAHAPAAYDVVVLGDSRALRGISPAEMSPRLGDARVFNFAFHAGGMNREMYRAGAALLDPEAPRKVLILAPTALAFMAHKQANSQFREYRAKPRDEVWLYTNARPLAMWLRPVPPSAPARMAIEPAPPIVLDETYTADGWIATDQTPPDDVTDLGIHRERLQGKRVESSLIADFMAQTREWTEQGIVVVSFHHPAFAPRVAMEDSILGFDPTLFAGQFRESGGVWIDTESGIYDTYDGSHLTRESAVRFSRDLADAVAGVLTGS